MLHTKEQKNEQNNMQRNKIILAKKTLKLLENHSFNEISINKFFNKEKNNLIKNKIDLLININRYFDFLLQSNLKSLESSSKKDMIFEVFMERLDILNSYRKSIKNIIQYLKSNPNKLLNLLPSFVKSIILMATITNIEVNSIKGVSKLKVLFILYFLIIYTWSQDESAGLEKTMTTLDKYLSNLEKLAKFIDA